MSNINQKTQIAFGTGTGIDAFYKKDLDSYHNFLGTFDTQYEINNHFITNIDPVEEGYNEALEDLHIDDDNHEVK